MHQHIWLCLVTAWPIFHLQYRDCMLAGSACNMFFKKKCLKEKPFYIHVLVSSYATNCLAWPIGQTVGQLHFAISENNNSRSADIVPFSKLFAGRFSPASEFNLNKSFFFLFLKCCQSFFSLFIVICISCCIFSLLFGCWCIFLNKR